MSVCSSFKHQKTATLVCPATFAPAQMQELQGVLNVELASSICSGEIVMPALMWIAFWSCMMGAATCWQEPAQVARVKGADRRDHPVA
jgi:hypothetical protein